MTREEFISKLQEVTANFHHESKYESDEFFPYKYLTIKLDENYAITLLFEEENFGFTVPETYLETVLIHKIDDEYTFFEYTSHDNNIDNYEYTIKTFNQLIFLIEELVQFLKNAKAFGIY